MFCEECGAPAPEVDDVPTCADHGRRWRMVRNAPCAAVVIADDAGRVLLSRRARMPFAGMWEVPGGFVELGEHPAQAARREAREELGLEVTLTGLVGVYVVQSQRGAKGPSGPLPTEEGARAGEHGLTSSEAQPRTSPPERTSVRRPTWLEIHVYCGTAEGEPSPDPAEVAEWRWCAPDEVPDVMAGDHRQRVADWAAGRAVPLPAGDPGDLG